MKKIFSLLLTLTMVLSLAACGGNSSTPSTPSEDGTQSDAANSDTIKIGYVSDLTGRHRPVGHRRTVRRRAGHQAGQ